MTAILELDAEEDLCYSLEDGVAPTFNSMRSAVQYAEALTLWHAIRGEAKRVDVADAPTPAKPHRHIGEAFTWLFGRVTIPDEVTMTIVVRRPA